jgi:signal transduction histidine kinase
LRSFLYFVAILRIFTNAHSICIGFSAVAERAPAQRWGEPWDASFRTPSKMRFPRSKRSLPSIGVFILIFLTPILFLSSITLSLYHDMVMVRTSALRTEMEKLRTQLARRSGRIEQYFDSIKSQDNGASSPHHLIPDEHSLRTAGVSSAFDAAIPEAYWAVVDPQSRIVLHSNRAVAGKQVHSNWDDVKEPEVASDVVRVKNSPLTGGVDAYDVSLPLNFEGKQWGVLHSGVEAPSLDGRIAAQRNALLRSRLWSAVPLAVINLAAIAAAAYLAVHCRDMRAVLGLQKSTEAKKLEQIGLGLAHEVRNPLHALRINIHTLKRALTTKLLSEQEMVDMMRESADEIDRMELLMRDLVQYAAPQPQEGAIGVELERELRAALQMLGDELQRNHVEVVFPQLESVLVVRMPPAQLRLILSELLEFAKRSAAQNGKLTIELHRTGGRAALSITDSGRDLSPTDLAKVFEPFHSTPFSNAGLALALVRRFVKEAGGSIERVQSPGANRFVLELPLAKDAPNGVT